MTVEEFRKTMAEVEYIPAYFVPLREIFKLEE